MKPELPAIDLADLLRRLPAAEPPRDLSRRVMAALPRRRGIPGRLEHAVARAFSARSSKSLFLPANPAEFGLFILSAGLFFCCLTAVIWTRMPFTGRFWVFLPALAAGLLLMGHGWRQLQSPGKLIPQQPGLAAVCGVFGINVILGLFHGLHSGPGLIAAWLGLSGILVAGGLGLVLAAPSVARRFSSSPADPLFPL
jgi:hypothetical protein